MKLSYFTADVDGGCAIMLGGMIRGFNELGFQLTKFDPSSSYDYVFLFNAASHIKHYNWNSINQLAGHRFVFVDTAEYGWWTHYDYYKDKYYSAFAPLSIQAKPPAQLKLLEFLEGKSYPYFLREMYKNWNYPENYYPIDYPLYYYSVPKTGPISFEEYKSRMWDFYILWGHSHQTRVHISEKIKKLPFRSFVLCDSNKKINQTEYFRNLQDSKLSFSYDGYGSGSFRETEVLSRCTLFRNKQIVERPNPLIDKVNFIEYEVEEVLGDDKYPIYVDTNLNDLVSFYLKDLESLYSIYCNGYAHCMKYFSEKGMSEYILNIVKEFKWDG